MTKMQNIHKRPMIILDFGSQYTQLIARRIRELQVYCEIHPYCMDQSLLKQLDPAGLILSGGPASTTQTRTPRAPDWLFGLGIPILGICYGMQTMASQLGGQVQASNRREYGYAALQPLAKSRLFEGLSDRTEGSAPELDIWMSHGDKVTGLPPGFESIGRTENTDIAAMQDEQRAFYGLQFHPEVTHSKQGTAILSRFLFDICQAEASWKPENIIEDAIAKIRAKVGQDKVLLGLSGGVDSSVVAALLHRAIGSQLHCVFIDTGLLRQNEAIEVEQTFEQHMGIPITLVKGEADFYRVLAGKSCPEEKRKAIGHCFVALFEKEAKRLPEVRWLAQGTIYPDVIESAAVSTANGAELIKSHHNVAGLPETMMLQLLEPLRELFKDEVRSIGARLGLPAVLLQRHPFPGPGLAVRILGEVQAEFANILRQADAIFIEELQKADLYPKVSQAFAVFLPVKSVGVMGDGRRYDYVICLRAVETSDFMTAEWAKLPWDFLGRVSNRIINEVQSVSRVCYDISGKPPATIEWE